MLWGCDKDHRPGETKELKFKGDPKKEPGTRGGLIAMAWREKSC